MKKFIWEDFAVMVIVGLQMSVLFLTRLLQGMLQDFTETLEEAERVFEMTEANPVMNIAVFAQQEAFILHLVLIPALIVGLYFLIRSKLGTKHRIIIRTVIVILLVITLRDFLNDLGVFISYGIRLGWF
jgi:hypothetical protein